MCHLVTIGTREGRASIDALMGSDFPLSLRRSTNPSLRSLFPKTDQLFEVYRGFCSCDIVASHREPPVEDRRAKLHALYSTKGWSEPKIARALAHWNSARERRLTKRGEAGRELVRLLHTLAERAGGVRVLIHFYSGRFDSEDISVVGTARVPVDRLVDGEVIAEDTLTDVVRAATRS
jgi:hypothetical protein